MPDDGSVCPVCGRQDNEIGLFIWVMSGNEAEPFCPGECLNTLLTVMREHGQHEAADALAQAAAEQLAGGWRSNVAWLEQHP